MAYTDDQIQEARKLIETLESLTNKYLAIAANEKRVTEKTRGSVIAGILVKEFGAGIFSHRVYNPFGADTLTAKFSNPNRSAK